MESENLVSRHAALIKKKASELAILCDAEVAIILIDSDGNISEFASSTSSIQKIVTAFKNCYKSDQCALKPKMEEPEKEVSTEIEPRQNTEEHKSRNVLGKDIGLMSLDEFVVLQDDLNKGMLSIKERKKEEVLQKNQILMKQVEDLQLYCPVPPEVHFPDMEGDAKTSSREYISSSSLAASIPITNSLETQHSFQNADTTSLPSTANSFVPFVFNYCDLFQPTHRASTNSAAPVSVDNRLSSSLKKCTVCQAALSQVTKWS